MSLFTDQHKVDIPEGELAQWKIERFTVSQKDAELESLRAVVTGSGRGVPAGAYIRLLRDKTLVMSDTPDEIRDHMLAIHLSRGNCLVHGLGLGIVANAMCKREEVERVTVVEISGNLIELVGSHWLKRHPTKLEIINYDAFMWEPPKGERYNVVWHDIWDNLCEDNLPEMHTLHRRYGRRADWQGSWGRECIERRRQN